MSLFVIADTHLSSDKTKSMEIFGARWSDYMNKLCKNWRAVVSDEDTVIVPGDISWALKLEDAKDDLLFLHSLPGRKLIGKGNHDFWWNTSKKMHAFLESLQIDSIDFLYNNAYLLRDCIVCGTRGWFVEENMQHTVGSVDYMRIVNREAIRLRLSLDAAKTIQQNEGHGLPILVFLHFPPVWNGFICREIVDLLHEFEIKVCYFGHIHGAYHMPKKQSFEGIEMNLCAADALDFVPMLINPSDF